MNRRGPMATNSMGKGIKTIGINMDTKLAAELERCAGAMYIFFSKYCKIILSQWIDSGKKIKLEEH